MVPKIRVPSFGGPHNKHYSILGSPQFGKLPFRACSLGSKVRLSILGSRAAQVGREVLRAGGARPVESAETH